MPRDTSGSYTLPAGNPVTTGTVIASNWANSTFSDVATALTDSLDRYGRGGMLAPFTLADGSQSGPSLAFTNEPGLGLYRFGTGDMAAVAQNIESCSFTSAGISSPKVNAAVTGDNTALTLTANPGAQTADLMDVIGAGASSVARITAAGDVAAGGDLSADETGAALGAAGTLEAGIEDVYAVRAGMNSIGLQVERLSNQRAMQLVPAADQSFNMFEVLRIEGSTSFSIRESGLTTISGGAAEAGLRLIANAAQSADVLEVRNSSNDIVAGLGPQGQYKWYGETNTTAQVILANEAQTLALSSWRTSGGTGTLEITASGQLRTLGATNQVPVHLIANASQTADMLRVDTPGVASAFRLNAASEVVQSDGAGGSVYLARAGAANFVKPSVATTGINTTAGVNDFSLRTVHNTAATHGIVQSLTASHTGKALWVTTPALAATIMEIDAKGTASWPGTFDAPALDIQSFSGQTTNMIDVRTANGLSRFTVGGAGQLYLHNLPSSGIAGQVYNNGDGILRIG